MQMITPNLRYTFILSIGEAVYKWHCWKIYSSHIIKYIESSLWEKYIPSPTLGLSLLDCKEIQPVHPRGNQSLMFIGRTDTEAETPILWPPDVKN